MAYKKGRKQKSSTSKEESRRDVYDMIGDNILKQIETCNTVGVTRETQGEPLFLSSNIQWLNPYSGINLLMTDWSLMGRMDGEKACVDAYGEVIGSAVHSKFLRPAQAMTGVNGFEQGAFKGCKKDTLITSPRLGGWVYADRFKDDGKNMPWREKGDDGNYRSPTKAEVKNLNLQQKFLPPSAMMMLSASDMVKNGTAIPNKLLDPIKRMADGLDLNRDRVSYHAHLCEVAKEAFGMKINHTPSIGRNTGGWFNTETDTITIRPIGMYKDSSHYMRILFHEMGHMMGGEDFHNRQTLREYSQSIEQRAKEELVAELTSAFVCGYYGIGTNCMGHEEDNPDLGSSSYLKSWSQALKGEDAGSLIRSSIMDARKGAKSITEAMNPLIEPSFRPSTRSPDAPSQEQISSVSEERKQTRNAKKSSSPSMSP